MDRHIYIKKEELANTLFSGFGHYVIDGTDLGVVKVHIRRGVEVYDIYSHGKPVARVTGKERMIRKVNELLKNES